MANRLVTFGEPGAAGPPGTTTLPNGRGLLGHNEQAFFDVPIDAVASDPWYRQVLRLQVGGALGWDALPTLPMPAAGAAKTAADGKVLMFDAALGYVLEELPPKFPTGTDGVIGVDAAGNPEVYPYAAAPDGAFARKVGSALTFSQLFVNNGYVKAAADGSFSYVALGNGLVEASGILSVDPGPGMIVDAQGVGIDATVVAQLSGGLLTPSQARGKSLISSLSGLFASGAVLTNGTTESPGNVLNSSMGTFAVGDEINVDVIMSNAHSSGTTSTCYYNCHVEITNPSSTMVQEIIVYTSGPMGRVSTVPLRHVVATAGTHRIRISIWKFDAGTASTSHNATARYNTHRL